MGLIAAAARAFERMVPGKASVGNQLASPHRRVASEAAPALV